MDVFGAFQMVRNYVHASQSPDLSIIWGCTDRQKHPLLVHCTQAQPNSYIRGVTLSQPFQGHHCPSDLRNYA